MDAGAVEEEALELAVRLKNYFVERVRNVLELNDIIVT